MKCRDCRYWDVEDENILPLFGICRRSPPIPFVPANFDSPFLPEGLEMKYNKYYKSAMDRNAGNNKTLGSRFKADWPVTNAYDWCGEWSGKNDK